MRRIIRIPAVICTSVLITIFLWKIFTALVILPTHSCKNTLTLVSNDFYRPESVVLKQFSAGKCVDEYKLDFEIPLNYLNWHKYKLPKLSDKFDSVIEVYVYFDNGSSAVVTYESQKKLYDSGLLIYMYKVYDWGYVGFVSGKDTSFFGKNTERINGENITVLTHSSADVKLPKFGYYTMTYTPHYSGWISNSWMRAVLD